MRTHSSDLLFKGRDGTEEEEALKLDDLGLTADLVDLCRKRLKEINVDFKGERKTCCETYEDSLVMRASNGRTGIGTAEHCMERF